MFSSSRCEVLFGAALLVSTAQAIIAPNTSLATVPCAYFGGNAQQRGAENIYEIQALLNGSELKMM